MSSVLVVSGDANAISELKRVIASLKLTSKVVSTTEQANEWLSMHKYSAVLVDARYENGFPLKLIQEAWKLNPLCVAGVFHLGGDVADEWGIRLAGARVFSRMESLEKIQEALESIPTEEQAQEQLGILLVEDLDSPRDIITAYVEALGFSHVKAVSSAKEALTVLETEVKDFFCVITDINMPEMNGIELIREIRKNKATEHLPTLVLTAYGTGENLVECIREGATGFLVKPLRKRELRLELEKARRVWLQKQNARLCAPEHANFLEDALINRGI